MGSHKNTLQQYEIMSNKNKIHYFLIYSGYGQQTFIYTSLVKYQENKKFLAIYIFFRRFGFRPLFENMRNIFFFIKF